MADCTDRKLRNREGHSANVAPQMQEYDAFLMNETEVKEIVEKLEELKVACEKRISLATATMRSFEAEFRSNCLEVQGHIQQTLQSKGKDQPLDTTLEDKYMYWLVHAANDHLPSLSSDSMKQALRQIVAMFMLGFLRMNKFGFKQDHASGSKQFDSQKLFQDLETPEKLKRYYKEALDIYIGDASSIRPKFLNEFNTFIDLNSRYK